MGCCKIIVRSLHENSSKINAENRPLSQHLNREKLRIPSTMTVLGGTQAVALAHRVRHTSVKATTRRFFDQISRGLSFRPSSVTSRATLAGGSQSSESRSPRALTHSNPPCRARLSRVSRPPARISRTCGLSFIFEGCRVALRVSRPRLRRGGRWWARREARTFELEKTTDAAAVRRRTTWYFRGV